jgi:YesN/AraC family two-component response regulator
MKAGCNKYMTKPIQKDLLLTSIDEFLNVDIEA